MTVAEGQSTRVPMPGGHIEVAEITGDSARRPLVLVATAEIEGSERPAVVAEYLVRFYA